MSNLKDDIFLSDLIYSARLLSGVLVKQHIKVRKDEIYNVDVLLLRLPEGTYTMEMRHPTIYKVYLTVHASNFGHYVDRRSYLGDKYEKEHVQRLYEETISKLQESLVGYMLAAMCVIVPELAELLEGVPDLAEKCRSEGIVTASLIPPEWEHEQEKEDAVWN